MASIDVRQQLARGLVIPACPLALNARRQWSERHQRAIVRYHAAAGAGGLAVGVHTTQFAIRDQKVGLYKPLLQLVGEELDRADAPRTALGNGEPIIRIGGICGPTPQAVAEAEMLRNLGWHAGLLSLGALAKADLDELLNHCARIAAVIPIVGFYLQPAAGGRSLPFAFWRRFVEIENVVAIKIAPFNRYQTLDVVRAVVEAGRDDIALYTGNDDQIVLDLLTPFVWPVNGAPIERRIVGGLLGHWAVWTKRAVELHTECRRLAESGEPIPPQVLQRNVEVTDCNAAFFDAANGFRGCIPGIHEVLRRQGLLEGTWCLDPHETLSPGQSEEIDRVYRQYPHLSDDAFVAEHRDRWFGD
jgi:dihydrodipicolinate synthase/N-acetylneuraminate lyase